MVMSIPIT